MERTRPKLDEWEDDLEAEQVWRDALSQGSASSAKVTRVSGGQVPVPAKPKSKFALQMANKRQQSSGAQSFEIDLEAEWRPQSHRKPVVAGLMGDIHERPSAFPSAVTYLPQPSTSRVTGFPLPPRRAHSPVSGSPISQTKAKAAQADYATENDERLAQMSPVEIAQEQQEVKEMLNEKTLAFLMSRKKGKQAQLNGAGKPLPCAIFTYENLILCKAGDQDNLLDSRPLDSSPHLHFSSATGAGLLFDKLGNLSTTKDEHAITHGHLPASSADSYSLDQLLLMTRSSIHQQRSFALSVLQSICAKQSSLSEVNAIVESLAEITLALIASPHRSVKSAAVNLAVIASGSLPAFASALQSSKSGFFVLLSDLLEAEDQPSRQILVSLCQLLVNIKNFEKLSEHVLLVERLQSLCLSVSWLPSTDGRKLPIPQFIDLLSALVCHSRVTATTVSTELASLQVLSRFLVIPFWQLDQSEHAYHLSLEITAKTFELLYNLAHYGLACEYRTTLSLTWSSYLSHQWTTDESEVAIQWVKLTRSWLTCAMAPHDTTPDHAVSWTQMQEWGEKVVDCVKADCQGEMEAEIWKCLAMWKKGSDLYLTEYELRTVQPLVAKRTKEVAQAMLDGDVSDSKIDLLLSGLLLCAALSIKSLSQDLATAVFEKLAETVTKIAPQQLTVALLNALLPHLADLISAKLLILGVSGSQKSISTQILAVEVLDQLSPEKAGALPVKQILEPFYTSSSSNSDYVLQPSAISQINSITPAIQKKANPVWPLQIPLDELLHSAESTILRKLPNSWNYGEVELVVAGLQVLLAIIKQLSSGELGFILTMTLTACKLLCLSESAELHLPQSFTDCS